MDSKKKILRQVQTYYFLEPKEGMERKLFNNPGKSTKIRHSFKGEIDILAVLSLFRKSYSEAELCFNSLTGPAPTMDTCWFLPALLGYKFTLTLPHCLAGNQTLSNLFSQIKLVIYQAVSFYDDSVHVQ